MRLPTVLLAAATFATLTAAEGLSVSFLPQDLPKKVATCKALNRASQEVKDIGIGMRHVDFHCFRLANDYYSFTTLQTMSRSIQTLSAQS